MQTISSERLTEIFNGLGLKTTIEEADFFLHLFKNISTLAYKIDELKILQKQVLNFEETCSYLNVSHSHLYKLTSQKQIPHFCPQGKKLYFKRDEIDMWLLRNRKSSTDEIERKAFDYIIRNPRK